MADDPNVQIAIREVVQMLRMIHQELHQLREAVQKIADKK